MNKIYAHLNSDNICEAITKYETLLDSPPSNYKELESFDGSLLGKKWNGSSWEAVEPTPDGVDPTKRKNNGSH